MSNHTWQQFLASQGAQMDAQGYAHFPASSAATSSLYDLSASLGLIAVSGADALNFLQGQLTNDITQLSHGAQFTGYCSAKGRLLALFYAWQQAHTIYLQCPQAMVEEVIKRLRMFVLRSKVSIEAVTSQWICLGLHGAALSSQFANLPSEAHQLCPTPLGTLIRLPNADHQPRALLLIDAESTPSAQTAWQTLAQQFTPTSTELWEALEIQAGIPQIIPATKEQFVPQMVNLDLLGGINFKKGCYTGQEIVARTHYLGTVKRRTFRASVQSEQAPQAGDSLLDTQQADCGQIVRVAPAEHGYQLLVECRLEAKEAGAISWQGHTLTWAEMPYSVV